MAKPKSRLPLLLFAALSAIAPVTIAPTGMLEKAELRCQDGTCCPEIGSFCVVGTYQRENKYYKPAGKCIDPT